MSDPSAPPSLHPFWDRSIRFLLRRPSHLQALVRLCQPDLAERLDFERLEQINRSFILDDFRQREADLVVRLPYRAATGDGSMIIYFLLEHQSTADPWMAFRLLQYMLQIWDEQRRKPQGTVEKLSAIVPFVFYTGSQAWSASRDLRGLIDAPAELLTFAPRFDILYVGLPETPPSALEAIGPFGWALRTVQRVDADQPEFAAVLERAAAAIRPLLGDEWRELIEFLLKLVSHRRPIRKQSQLLMILLAAAPEPQRRAELSDMAKTMTDVWFEQGLEKGLEQGLEKGIEKGLERGRKQECRTLLLRLGTRSFGTPSAPQVEHLHAIHEVAKLESLSELILDASGWDDLLGRA